MKFYVFLFLMFFTASCHHLKSIEKRNPANSGTETLKVMSPEEFLPLNPYQCPEGTSLVFGDVDVKVDHCLKNYIHKKTAHGVIREKICFPDETRHEARLRIPVPGKVYGAVIRSIYYPTLLQKVFVSLNLNHAYYSLEVVGENLSDLSPKDVKKLMRETPLPKKVRLERCECNVKENSDQECHRRLSPVLQEKSHYLIELNEVGTS